MPEFIIGDEKVSRQALNQLLDRYLPIFERHRNILVHSGQPISQNVSLHLCEKTGNALFLCPAYFKPAQIDEIIAQHHIDLCIYDGDIEHIQYHELEVSHAVQRDPAIYVFTTGTTGMPKLIKHSWETISVSSRAVGKRLQEKMWLMSYATTGYAGLQIFFSATRSNGTIVYVPQGSFPAYCESISKHDVNIISGTPTFWRLLINAWPQGLPKPRLEQATIGGEVVTQDILDVVDQFFQPINLTHIYASTEVGTVIIVSDKKAGFPASYIDPERVIKFRVVEDVLEVSSPSRMKSQVRMGNFEVSDVWISTGDLVQLRDGRYFFCGRRDGRVNIGGSKVLPEEVEGVLLRFEQVKECVVYEKKSPIVGSLLAVDIVLTREKSLSIEKLKKELSVLLPSYKIPQYIRFVKEIVISENGKKIRK